MEKRILYEEPKIEITRLQGCDVISTSTPGWNNENVDSSGWT